MGSSLLRPSTTTPSRAYSKTPSTGSPVCPISRSPEKPIALESRSPSLFGGIRAQLHLRHVFVYLDGRVLNKPEVIIPLVNTKIDAATGELTDPATRGFIADQLTAFATFVRG